MRLSRRRIGLDSFDVPPPIPTSWSDLEAAILPEPKEGNQMINQRTYVAFAIHDALCGRCDPNLHRGLFTREDSERAAEAVVPIVDRVLNLAEEIGSGTLGHLEPGQVAYLIRLAVFDSSKAAFATGKN